MVIPLQDSHPVYLILGVLGCLKFVLPHINKTERNQEMKGSFGRRHEISDVAFSLDRLLQVICFTIPLHVYPFAFLDLRVMFALRVSQRPQRHKCLFRNIKRAAAALPYATNDCCSKSKWNQQKQNNLL